MLPEISFDMPPLQGGNIREHFLDIGQQTAEPYLSMAKEFADADLPEMPRSWELDKPGWTRYGRDGSVEAVEDLGDETVVSFDVEVLYKLSSYPVMSTAVTPNAWYSWLSPSIFEPPPASMPDRPPPWDTRTPTHYPHDLIPMFRGSAPRVAIGHNVGYDRARVFEEYDLERTSTRWLDTLSLHVATRGITSVQRPAWIKHKKNKLEKLLREGEVLAHIQEIAEAEGDLELVQSVLEHDATNEAESSAAQKTWEDVTSVNSLAEVASLHCGYAVDKSIRSRFGDDDITHASLLRPELHDLLTYCAIDVRITHDVYKKVLPLFLRNCPHPASFAGILSMGNSFLPVNESWEAYLQNAEMKYREMDEGVRKALRLAAEQLRKSGPTEGDPWHSQLDWTPKPARWPDETSSGSPGPSVTSNNDATASSETTVASLSSGTSSAEHIDTAVPDTLPAWYAPIIPDRSNLTSKSSQRYLLPLLLRMSYKGFPVAYLSDHLWCFMVPYEAVDQHIDKHGAPVTPSPQDAHLDACLNTMMFFRISGDVAPRKSKLVGPGVKTLVKTGEMTSPYPDLLSKAVTGSLVGVEDDLFACAGDLLARGAEDEWGVQLDWMTQGTGKYRIYARDGLTRRLSCIFFYDIGWPTTKSAQEEAEIIPPI